MRMQKSEMRMRQSDKKKMLAFVYEFNFSFLQENT